MLAETLSVLLAALREDPAQVGVEVDNIVACGPKTIGTALGILAAAAAAHFTRHRMVLWGTGCRNHGRE
jgi:hypothetical protein